MNPAQATSRGEKLSSSAASTFSNASRVGKSACLTTRTGMPRLAAISRPPAPATLLMTADTAIPASRIACRLLPRPEMRTTSAMSHDPEEDRIAAVGEARGFDAFGLPVADAELVRNDARARPQLGAEL